MSKTHSWRLSQPNPAVVGLFFIVVGLLIGGVGVVFTALAGHPPELVRLGVWLIVIGFIIGFLAKATGTS